MKVTIRANTGDTKIAVKDLKPGQMFFYAPNNDNMTNDIMMIASYAHQTGVDKIAICLSNGEAREVFGEWMIDQRDLLNDISVSFEI